MKNKNTLWLFLGIGSQLQIVGSLSFSELFIFVVAPFLFFNERSHLKRNGIMPFFYLSLALVLGCVVACVANHTALPYVIRGLAVCILMPCAIIVTHRMLRTGMSGLKWYFVGVAISSVLSTFVFQKSVEVADAGGVYGSSVAATSIMGGATYWIHRLGNIVTVPAKGWYLSCPIAYCVCAPLFMAGFSMLTSVSGRGSAARALASAVLVILGGKKRMTLRSRICKNFWLIMVLGVVGAFVIKQAYQISASSGWLGEGARIKYEGQTKGDKSLKALLLGGRMESFCGLLACVDKPIIGFGPWAYDYGGYQAEFLSKYADSDDYNSHIRSVAYAQAHGYSGVGLIPCHAVITELWLWYGIFGLLFCLYIFYSMLRYLKEDCWVIPQWFFWLGASIPGMFWDMCFNPFSNRVGTCLFIVACLMVRAVRLGKQQLPYEMIVEIQKAERK